MTPGSVRAQWWRHRRGVWLALILLAATASAALAVAPRGNANYIAVDHQGRPAITLWMQTKTKMWVFVCYDWHRGPNEGNHYDNNQPITVTPKGRFSYDGPAADLKGKQATLKLSGHFATQNKAVGTITAPCMTNRRFTAHYSAH
jgi:hypothetical protein